MNKKKSILESNVLYTIIAIIAGFLIGAIFLMVAGISPAVAYGKLFSSIFSKPKYLVWTLVYASPLIFTGLSVAFSFRTGVFNIGAEGQFVIGGLVACVLGIVLDLPPVIHAIVCLVAAALAGGIWSLIVCLYFFPLPQGQGSLRPIFCTLRGCFFTLPSPAVVATMPSATRSRLTSASLLMRAEKMRRTVSS